MTVTEAAMQICAMPYNVSLDRDSVFSVFSVPKLTGSLNGYADTSPLTTELRISKSTHDGQNKCSQRCAQINQQC